MPATRLSVAESGGTLSGPPMLSNNFEVGSLAMTSTKTHAFCQMSLWHADTPLFDAKHWAGASTWQA